MIVTPCGLGSAGTDIAGSVGVGIMAYAPAAGPAAPVVAVVGALVVLGSKIASAIHLGEGCGETCKQATEVVNQIEPVMLSNVQAYQANNYSQEVAVDNFNKLWTTVQQSCGAIPGDAGKNCVDDRKEGACKWKDSGGECWNWFKGYRDPLLVGNQSVGGSSDSSMVGSMLGGDNTYLMMGVGVLALGWMLSRAGDK